MNWKPIILVCLWTVLCVFPAMARMYKYTDENGVVRFTDDPSQIPREKLKQIQEELPESDQEQPSKSKKKHRPKMNIPTDHRSVNKLVKSGKRNQLQQRALSEKIELDAEYRKLLEEKSALESQKDKLNSKTARKEYTARMKALKNAILANRRRHDQLQKVFQKIDEEIEKESLAERQEFEEREAAMEAADRERWEMEHQRDLHREQRQMEELENMEME